MDARIAADMAPARPTGMAFHAAPERLFCRADEPVRGPDGGAVADPERITFLDGHIRAVHAAIAAGSACAAASPWCLIDNFKWAEGYHQRFGLTYVDFEDAGAHSQGVVRLARRPRRGPARLTLPVGSRTFGPLSKAGGRLDSR
jgi:hypothetical protein